MRRKRVSPYLWMLGGSLAFAVMAVLAHALAVYGDWQVIALARTGLALVFTALLALAAGVRLVWWKPRTLWMRSIAGSVSLVGTFFAYTRLPVSDVLALTSMFPIWVALLSWPLLKHRPSGGVWLAVLSSVAGVTLIQQPHFTQGNFASLIALASSLATAIAVIGLHKLQEIDVRAVVVHFSGVSFLFCIGALLLFERETTSRLVSEGQPLLMLLAMGVMATIGQLFLTKAFVSGPAASVSVVCLSQIVFAMVLEVLLWQQSYNPETLLGMGLVIAPSAWLMIRQA